MLRVLSHSKRQRPKRHGPRTVQEAAEAFISHVANMERELARALRDGEFDVSNVRDLENLVPVVESALEYASRAMNALVIYKKLKVDMLYLSQDDIVRVFSALKQHDEKPEIEVALGLLREETFHIMSEMGTRLDRYINMFSHFVGKLLSLENDGMVYHTNTGETYKGIYEKLVNAISTLGTVPSWDQVKYEYDDQEQEMPRDRAREREKAAQLARFACKCYYTRLRDKGVSFFEQVLQKLYLDEVINLLLKALANRGRITRQDYDVTESDSLIKEKKRGVIQSIDLIFRDIGDRVHAMDIKTRINELVSRLPKSTSMVRSVADLEALEARVVRVTKAHEALVRIAESEVHPFLIGLVSQLDYTPKDLQGAHASEISSLIPHFMQYIGEINELIKRALKEAKAAKAAAMAARAEEERREEEERSAESSGDDYGESEDEDRVINESKEKLDAVIISISNLNNKLNLVRFPSSSVFGSSSGGSSSAFGRYVRRAAKHTVRVAPRAWGA